MKVARSAKIQMRVVCADGVGTEVVGYCRGPY